MRALDIQELTQPVQTVLCPARHDIITVGNCRQCRDFRGTEQSPVQGSFVACNTHDTKAHSASALSVRERVQLPSLCASVHSTLAVLLPYADNLRPWEAIPILDREAKPVGIVSSVDLSRFRAAQLDPSQRLQRLMSTSFVTVFPSMSLADAARLRAEHTFRGAVVVSEDDAFIGVVWEPVLERAGSSTLDDTAQPL
jgi:CBS domain-containing protein